MARRGGIVPIVGGDGQWSPVWTRRFDFENAPDDEYFEAIAQAVPLVGMRSRDSLQYAPHALQEVHSNPYNLLRNSGNFDAGGWAKANGLTVKRINGSDFVLTVGTGINDELNQTFTWPVGWPVTFGLRMPKLPSDAAYPWHRVYIADGSFDHRMTVWFNGATGQVGIVLLTGTAVQLGAVTVETSADGETWDIRAACRVPDAVSESLVLVLRMTEGDGNYDVPPAGTETLLRDTLVTATDAAGAFRPPFVPSNDVGALQNWTKSGEVTAAFGLAVRDGRIVYRLDNAAGAAQAAITAVGGAGAAVPHSSSVAASTNGAPFTTLAQTSVAEVGQSFGAVAEPGEVVDFYEPQWCEGPKVFDLLTEGYARHMVRRRPGEGRLNEAENTNKCFAASLAPTDLTGVTDGGTTTTVVARADLPADVKAALDAGPYDAVMAMYRTQGSGTAYVTGQAGNTNEHFIRGLLWAETGTAGAVLGLEGAGIAPISGVEMLEWVEGKGTPASPTDRLTITVIGGDVYWIAEMMHEGAAPESHIAVNGSARVRAEERPGLSLGDAGIDARQNHTPDEYNWQGGNDNGWTMALVGSGPGYRDYRFTGAVSGLTIIFNTGDAQAPAAQQGQTWGANVRVAVVAGSLANVTRTNLRIVERSGGSGTVDSALQFRHLLNGLRRDYWLSRTLTEAATDKVSYDLLLDGAGAVDFTLRLSHARLMRASEWLPHIETSGTAIPFAQWLGGLTVLDRWDSADISNNSRFWEMADSAGTVSSRIFASNAGIETSAYFDVAGIGNITGPVTVVGDKTQQQAMKNGDQATFVDNVAVGTLAAPLPVTGTRIFLGNRAQGGRVRRGIQKSITLYGTHTTDWMGG